MPSVIDGHRIERELGAGGYGKVYLARDRDTNERIAIKTLLTTSSSDEELQAFFRKEYELLERLSHRSIVTVHRQGIDDQNGLYYSMDYLADGNMETAKSTGKATVPVLLNMWIDVLHAMRHAHQKSLFHRDLKPANLMINGNEIVIVDWGIGRGAASNQHITTPRGTPLWAPAEYMNDGTTGPFTDTYALTGLLGWILTDLSPRQLSGQESQKLLELGYSDRDLLGFLEYGLSMSHQRYQTIDELWKEAAPAIVTLKRLMIRRSANAAEACSVFWPRLMQVNSNDLHPRNRRIDFYRQHPNGLRRVMYHELPVTKRSVVDAYLRLGLRLAEEAGMPEETRTLWRIHTANGNIAEQQWLFGSTSDPIRFVRDVGVLAPADQQIVFDFLLLGEEAHDNLG